MAYRVMIIKYKSILMECLAKRNTRKTSYYQNRMNFKLGNFQKAIELEKPWLNPLL
jgi:hypothetical protein